MTPEQLRAYVDGIVQNIHTWILLFWVTTPIINAIVTFVSVYLSEKGKNRAQREDAAIIAGKIEEAKIAFSERLETYRADFARRLQYGKIQYEQELLIYKDLWRKLCGLEEAVSKLRPIIDPEERENVAKEEIIDKFSAAIKELWETLRLNRPFYPAIIWVELQKVIGLCLNEAVEYQHVSSLSPDYLSRAFENREAITNHIEVVCDLVRQRLSGHETSGKQSTE